MRLHTMSPVHARPSLSLLSAVLLVAACDGSSLSPNDAPTVTVLADAVADGQAVPMRVRNASTQPWDFSVCPGTFERQVGDGWEAVPPTLTICAAGLSRVTPGESVDVTASLGAGAPAGTYRTLVKFTNGGNTVDRVSNSFVLGDGPAGEAPTVTVLEATAPRGTNLTVRLSNTTALRYGFNLCSSGRYERLVDGEWTQTAEPLWLCTGQIDHLDAGEVEEAGHPVLADLVPGTYRLRVQLWRDLSEPVLRYSNAFVIT